MSSRPGSWLLAVVVPALLLAPSAAHAEKVVTDDAAGDAQEVTFVATDESPDETMLAPAPDETSSDITRTVVAHGNTRLSITVHLRDLVLGSSGHQVYVRLATSRRAYIVSVSKEPGSRADAALTRKNGTDVDCRALRVALDGAADTVSLSLPTSCIDAPRWVQVGVGMVRVEPPADSADPMGLSLFADDGHRDGDLREDDVAKGPKVRRG